MALVAYDNSDSSEFEDEEGETATVITLENGAQESSVSQSISTETSVPDDGPSLFNLLPQPSTVKPSVIEEDDEFLHKKDNIPVVKTKAKITVPSLSDFKDVEDRPAARPKMANGKKSGLLSMLPQPRNAVTSTTKSLIPHVLTQKPTTAKKKQLPPVKKANTETIKALVTSYSDDSDNDDEVQTDFFSINKPVEMPVEDIPLDIDVPKQSQIVPEKKPHNIESYFKKDEVQSHVELQPDYEPGNSEYHGSSEATSYDASSSYSNGYAAPETSNSSEVLLDDEAILKLCGTRGKRKREDIQIVDVNQQEVLDEARQWLMKGLMDDTSKRVSSSKKKGNEPTTQQRRKHQITYLAHQAKANEAELQNQWANSRMSKRQTQSKYGF